MRVLETVLKIEGPLPFLKQALIGEDSTRGKPALAFATGGQELGTNRLTDEIHRE
jgi:hypothetical protein